MLLAFCTTILEGTACGDGSDFLFKILVMIVIDLVVMVIVEASMTRVVL